METGSVLWIYEWGFYSGRQVADPLLIDGMVFILPYYEPDCVLLDITGTQPKVLWKKPQTVSAVSSPVFIDGFIYVNCGGLRYSSLMCIAIETGELMWEEQLRRKMVSFTGADNKLIVLTDRGELSIIEANPREFKVISSCDVLEVAGTLGMGMFWTPPVLYRGRIYCRNYLNDLICIDVDR